MVPPVPNSMGTSTLERDSDAGSSATGGTSVMRATVLLDSGVRRGSDIVKALALGAKAVLTGRATLYGTAAGGEAGAAHAISILKTEMDKTMAYTGCNRVDEISTDIFFGDRERNRMMAD